VAKEHISGASIEAEYVGSQEIVAEYIGGTLLWTKDAAELKFTVAVTEIGWTASRLGARTYRIVYDPTARGGVEPYNSSPGRTRSNGALVTVGTGDSWFRAPNDRTGEESFTFTMIVWDSSDPVQRITVTVTTDYERDPTLPNALIFTLTPSAIGWQGRSTSRFFGARFDPVISGGTAPYSYSPIRNWANGQAWARNSPVNNDSLRRNGGTVSLTVTVTDSGSPAQSVSKTASQNFDADPTFPQQTLRVDAGDGYQFARSGFSFAETVTATATGGVAPYRFVWSGTGVTLGNNRGQSIRVNAFDARAGSTVSVRVTDSTGARATDTATIRPFDTSPPPTEPTEPLALTLRVTNQRWQRARYAVFFRATASGGTPPYSYPDSSLGLTTHAFYLDNADADQVNGGTITITARVFDSTGAVASASQMVDYPPRS